MTHSPPASATLSPRPGAAQPGHGPETATRPWAPLSDPEWAALAPLLPRSRHPALRHRLNCILGVAAHGVPWVPAGGQGPFWPTVYRHFHRWARAGVWSRLHRAAGEAAAPPALRALADWAAALHRRAVRIAPRHQALNSENPKTVAAEPQPVPAFAPAAPSTASTFFSPISGFTPLNSKTADSSCPAALRPLAEWRGAAALLSASPRCQGPRPAAVCRNGEWERAA
ncbi:transposase [Dankookia sp. GCM10030260]|uniref:transposase n=1 Tax=Dankookia sp. GCM10030260 TaxID=3273390 RepID=UPI00362255FA